MTLVEMVMGGLAGIFMIGFLVVVHEFGHFVIAKWFGIGVPVFSVGMGPRLWGFEHKGTDYRISAVPVGGYVQMSGADPFGDPDWDLDLPDDQNFMKKPVWQRLLVMLGGPLFNLATPFVLFTAVLMLGEPHLDAMVGEVYPSSAGEKLGLRPGDRVSAVNEVPVNTWAEVQGAIDELGPGSDLSIVVTRDSSTRTLAWPASEVVWVEGQVDLVTMGITHRMPSARVGVDDPASPAGMAGIELGDGVVSVDGQEVRSFREMLAALGGSSHTVTVKRPVGDGITSMDLTLQASEWQGVDGEPWANRWGLVPVEVFVWDFHDNEESGESPARTQGMMRGDRIVSIDGMPIAGFHQIVSQVRATAPTDADGESVARSLELVIRRDGLMQTRSFTPRMDRKLVPGGIRYLPYIGVESLPDATLPGDTTPVYYGPLEAARRSLPQVSRAFGDAMKGLASLVTGETRIREGLGGPVAIFGIAAQAAERGLYFYARLIGMFSISLGLINLLPIPALDGGQILFYSLEGIRGRPLPLVIRERIQMAGVLFLVGLMLLVTVFDVNAFLFNGGVR